MKMPTSPSPSHVGQEVRKRVAGSRPVPPHLEHVSCCPKRAEADEAKVVDNIRKINVKKISFFLIIYPP